MKAREELYAALMSGGPHSPDRSELASARIDAVVVETIRGDADWLEGIGEHFAASMLRHQADGEPGEEVPGEASPNGPTATRERTITHTWPGKTPFLTVHLTFGNDWTDAGVDEVTDRVQAAARYGFTDTPVDQVVMDQDAADDEAARMDSEACDTDRGHTS